jgi:hypothetical protein
MTKSSKGQRPDTQSDPKNRRGTKTYRAHKVYCNTFTDQHGQRITTQRLGGMLASTRVFKKVVKKLILNDAVAKDFQGRVQRQCARNWLSYCIDLPCTGEFDF